MFQHDRAPAHTVKSTKEWFTEQRITLLDWPENSPDANPKENLWVIIKRRLRKYYPDNLKELKQVITEVQLSCYHRIVMG